MNLKNIARTLAPVAIGVAMAAGVSALPAQAAPLQFTATVQSPYRILTSQHLFAGEHIAVGLDGFKETVLSVQNNGGGTVAFLKYALPQSLRPLTPVLFTVQP